MFWAVICGLLLWGFAGWLCRLPQADGLREVWGSVAIFFYSPLYKSQSWAEAKVHLELNALNKGRGGHTEQQ